MFRKLCILLIFSKLNVFNHLIYNYRIHNLYAIFAKFLDICKQMAGDLVNEHGDMPRWELSPGSQTWKSIAQNMTSEAIGIDSESFFFAKLPTLIRLLHRKNLYRSSGSFVNCTITPVLAFLYFVQNSGSFWFDNFMLFFPLSRQIEKQYLQKMKICCFGDSEKEGTLTY